jgi:predicted HAD superfamily Cof-like phosphohydrolase
MSKDWYLDMVDFHKEVMLDNFSTTPNIPSEKYKSLRKSLITEEVNKELIPAIEEDDLEGIADGAIDSIVVILGTLVSYGIDPRPIWDEILETNLAKKDGPMRADGKRLKPEGWTKPRVRTILEEQVHRGWYLVTCEYCTKGCKASHKCQGYESEDYRGEV